MAPMRGVRREARPSSDGRLVPCRSLRALRVASKAERMVGRAGIEPATLWLKARCSTPELAAHSDCLSNVEL